MASYSEEQVRLYRQWASVCPHWFKGPGMLNFVAIGTVLGILTNRETDRCLLIEVNEWGSFPGRSMITRAKVLFLPETPFQLLGWRGDDSLSHPVIYHANNERWMTKIVIEPEIMWCLPSPSLVPFKATLSKY